MLFKEKCCSIHNSPETQPIIWQCDCLRLSSFLMFFFSSETRTVEKRETQKYYSEYVCIDLFQILFSILFSLFLAEGVVKYVSMALQAGVFLIRRPKRLFLDHYRGKTEHRSWHCSQFLLGLWYHLLFNSRKGINLELLRCQHCSVYWLNLLYPQICSVISSVSSRGFYCKE